MTEPATQPAAPASFVALFDSVERKINSVIDGARPLDVTGAVLNEALTYLDEDDADDSLVEAVIQQAEEIARLKRALAGHIFDGESLSTRETVRSELIEQGFKRIEQHAALEEIAHAQQQQLAAAARQTSTYQRSVIDRDEIIAEKQRTILAQNDIISGLHAQRRTQVGQLNAAVISLFEALGIDSVVVSDERMRQTAARTAGAQYALTVTHERSLMQTRFEITNTKGQLA